MKTKPCQVSTASFCHLAVKTLSLIASMLILGSFAMSHAQQKQSVFTKITFLCSTGTVASYDEFTTVQIEIDAQPIRNSLESVPVGPHNLKVTPQPPPGEGRTWIVKEIKLDEKLLSAPNRAPANVPITIPYRGPAATPRLEIIVDQCGAVAPATERLPIIFLPGVAGTEIWQPWERTDVRGEDRRVWPFRTLSGLPGERFNMMLDRDGRNAVNGRVVIGDILRSYPVDFYSEMVTFFTGKGYQEYKQNDTEEAKKRASLFILPYDWRLDCNSEDHFNRLDQLISTALQTTGAKKVILLAHSMGGVIARGYLISRPASAAKVESLISMGTPYWGSVKPYYGLVDGYDFGNPFIFNSTMKILARNFPAAHFLLPQLPFITDLNGQQLSLDESFSIQYKGYVRGPGGIDDYTKSDTLIWNINAPLLERARNFWTRMGTVANPTPLPAGVKHYVIIGVGNRTMNGYKLEAATDDDYVAIGSRKVKGVPQWGDGDITVPLELAQIKTATQTYYVQYKHGAMGSKIGRASSEHGDLPKNPTALNIVWQIIDGKAPDQGTYDYLRQSSLQNSECVDFTLHSDAHLSISDEGTGERLGFNNQEGIDQTLPTGSFLTIGEAEYASLLNVSNQYKVTVEGIREGKFTLEINISRGGNTLTRFYYPDVPVRKGTIAQLNLKPSQASSSPPTLTVTTEGRTTEIPASIGTATGSGTSTAVKPMPPSSGGIGGTWTAPSGEVLILVQSGNSVTGTYRGILGTGAVSGSFDGRTFTGTIEAGVAGITAKQMFSLTLTSDGTLEGRLGSSILGGALILTKRP